MNVTLSLRGTPIAMESALSKLLSVVNPLQPPSVWIDRLSELIKRLAPTSVPTNNLWNAMDGVLIYPRSEDSVRRLFIPITLFKRLQEEGGVSVRPNKHTDLA